MKVSSPTFKGEIPRIDPTKIPDTFSESADNPRLLSGTLQAWKNFSDVITLSKTAPINTIYYLAQQYWLEWNESDLADGAVCVDVARGIIPGDTTYRTYLTGLDAPRYTNIDLATTGVPPYPVETRLLGVVAPDTAPTAVVNTEPEAPGTDGLLRDVYDQGDQLASWNYSPYFYRNVDTLAVRIVDQSSTIGNPQPSYHMYASGMQGFSSADVDPAPPYMFKDFGVGSDAVVLFETDILIDSSNMYNYGWHVMTNGAGVGPGVWLQAAPGGNLYLTLGSTIAWGRAGRPLVPVLSVPVFFGLWHRMSISMVRESGTSTMKATLKRGSTVLGELSLANANPQGGCCGMFVLASGDDGSELFFDNILVQSRGTTSNGTSTTPGTTDTTATSYVYTFVNDIGEESAPSPASATVLRPDGVTITVTSATTPPTGPDYHIETKRIYRAVTGASGTSFQFVAEIPVEQADYDDNIEDSALGEVLESDDWDLPPSDLRGILALPNGIMVGYRRNQLCFSAQNHPHAWPVGYRLNTDTDIAGIGAIDTSVVVTTQAFPYLASGNNPAAYSMAKLEEPQGCVSKRSVSYLRGFGVVYASPDGLMAIAGPGKPANITEGIFTREEWQALNPSSIIGTFHDDRYWAFYDTGESKGGFVIDVRQSGFGKISLTFHATAVYTDPLTDTLYLVLDENDEPSDPLGVAPVDVPSPGNIVYAFDTDTENKLTYSYSTKLWEMTSPTNFQIAQVKARDYENVVARFLVDGVDVYGKRVTSNKPFVLPAITAESTFQMKLIGTSDVTQIEAAEDVGELT